MFGRFRDRLFGNKKSATITSNVKPKKKQNGAGRARSKTLGNITEDSNLRTRTGSLNFFDDEFRKNDINAFDLVIVDKRDLERNAIPMNGSSKPAQKIELASSLVTSGTKYISAEVKDNVIAEVDENSITRLSDLAALSSCTEKNGDIHGNIGLSSDEKQSLDILDSVVNEFAIFQDSENHEDWESKYDEASDRSDSESVISQGVQIRGSQNHDNSGSEVIGDTTEISSVAQSIAEKSYEDGRSTDYGKVFGDADMPPAEPGAERDNWQITGFSKLKPIRFVSTTSMYLPSPQEERKNAHELFPTNHTEMENEQDGSIFVVKL